MEGSRDRRRRNRKRRSFLRCRRRRRRWRRRFLALSSFLLLLLPLLRCCHSLHLHLDFRGQQRLQGLQHRPLAAPDAPQALQGQGGEDRRDRVGVLGGCCGLGGGGRSGGTGGSGGAAVCCRRGSSRGGGGTCASTAAAPAGELEPRQPGPDPRHGELGRDAAAGFRGRRQEGEGNPFHSRRASSNSSNSAFVSLSDGDRRGRPRPDGRRALVRAPLDDDAGVVAVVGRGALAPLVLDRLQGLLRALMLLPGRRRRRRGRGQRFRPRRRRDGL